MAIALLEIKKSNNIKGIPFKELIMMAKRISVEIIV